MFAKPSFQVLDKYKLWYKPDPTINRLDQFTLKDFLYHVVLSTAYSKSLKHIYWLYIPHFNDKDSKFVKQHTHVNPPSWFLITGYRSRTSNGKHDKTTSISFGQIWSNVTATCLKIILSSTKMDQSNLDCWKTLPTVLENPQSAKCVRVLCAGRVEQEERSRRSGCEKANQSGLGPRSGGCWGREAPHELAGKRPQGAGAHVNEETAAAATAIHPPLRHPLSHHSPPSIPTLDLFPQPYCPCAYTGPAHANLLIWTYLQCWYVDFRSFF